MLQNLDLNSPFAQGGVTCSHFYLPLTCPLKTEALQRSWTGSKRPDVAKCSQVWCWSTSCMDCHGLVHGAGYCDSLPENRQFPDKLIRVNEHTHTQVAPSKLHPQVLTARKSQKESSPMLQAGAVVCGDSLLQGTPTQLIPSFPSFWWGLHVSSLTCDLRYQKNSSSPRTQAI